MDNPEREPDVAWHAFLRDAIDARANSLNFLPMVQYLFATERAWDCIIGFVRYCLFSEFIH